MGNHPVDIWPDEGQEQITAEQFDEIYDLLYPLADRGWKYERSPLASDYIQAQPKNASEELKEFADEEANPTPIRRRKLPVPAHTIPAELLDEPNFKHGDCRTGKIFAPAISGGISQISLMVGIDTFSDQTHPWKSTNIDSAFHQYCKKVNLES